MVDAEFTRREIELNIVHVRTRDFWTQLEAKNVDLVCGSIATTPGPDPALDAYDVIEWQREDLALITNLPLRELPVASVTQDRLPGIPLLAPSAGLIADFLRRWYGHDFRDQLHIVAEVDSIYYGLALLRSRLVHGALIATGAAAQAAIEGRLREAPASGSSPCPGFQTPAPDTRRHLRPQGRTRPLPPGAPAQPALGCLRSARAQSTLIPPTAIDRSSRDAPGGRGRSSWIWVLSGSYQLTPATRR